MSELLRERISKWGTLVLDGGLATELERRGFDLSDSLWSARLLRDAPDAIRTVHTAWLQSGADIIITASYQASVPGFVSCGLSPDEAKELIRLSVRLARDAVRDFESGDRLRPLVAASIGPYGAFLADGSEYRGGYDIDQAELRAFHADRWELLSESGPDVMACETVPGFRELEVLLELADGEPERPVWLSCSCRDGLHISDGTPIRECAARAADCAAAAAIGVNCTAPQHVESLIAEARRGAPRLAVVVYPNSGETWDAASRCWRGDSSATQFAEWATRWRDAGASIIGGCCRTTVEHIAEMRRVLRGRRVWRGHHRE